MRNAELQGKVVCRTTLTLTFRIPHSTFRILFLTKRLQLHAVFRHYGVPAAVQKRPRVEIHPPVAELHEGGAVGVGEDHEAEVGASAEEIARELGLRPGGALEHRSVARLSASLRESWWAIQ